MMQVTCQAQFRTVNSIGHFGRCSAVADPRPFRGEKEGERPLPASCLERSQENTVDINREQ